MYHNIPETIERILIKFKTLVPPTEFYKTATEPYLVVLPNCNVNTMDNNC